MVRERHEDAAPCKQNEQYGRLIMDLRPVLPHQINQDLEEFFTPSGDEDFAMQESLSMMRDFVITLKQTKGSDKQYALQMILLSLSDIYQPGVVTISAWDGKYKLEYRLVGTVSPWSDARVVGYTVDVHEAVNMMHKALFCSGIQYVHDLGGVEAFINKVAPNTSGYRRAMANRILALINEIKKDGKLSEFIFYTSDFSLWLFDKGIENECIKITTNETFYIISYPFPDNMAPWPDARVEGATKNEAEATAMLTHVIHLRSMMH
jgi:hypothetical protein